MVKHEKSFVLYDILLDGGDTNTNVSSQAQRKPTVLGTKIFIEAIDDGKPCYEACGFRTSGDELLGVCETEPEQGMVGAFEGPTDADSYGLDVEARKN